MKNLSFLSEPCQGFLGVASLILLPWEISAGLAGAALLGSSPPAAVSVCVSSIQYFWFFLLGLRFKLWMKLPCFQEGFSVGLSVLVKKSRNLNCSYARK